MTRTRLFLSAPALVMVLGLAACNTREFNSELGSEVDNGTFGNPTMNNELVMTGKIDAQVALGQRLDDLLEDGVDDPLDMPLGQMRVLIRDLLDQFRTDHP